MIVLTGAPHNLGDGFVVRRILPQSARRTIGPFVFLDHFGPVDFAPGKGIDVRPHPHIGLATITYLFEGAQMHRDSLGSVQDILPGDVNLMLAGRGIVHSERTGPETRARGHRMHGIQSWVGLPTAHEEDAPSFQHVAKSDLPIRTRDGVMLRVAAGTAYGFEAPLRVPMRIFYVDVTMAAGSRLALPDNHEERAALVVDGSVAANGEPVATGAMAVFDPGEEAVLTADQDARVMLLGGAPLDGPRHLWWNFVSSSQIRIEQAKDDWLAMRLGTIPSDHDEFIPLPPTKPSPVPPFE